MVKKENNTAYFGICKICKEIKPISEHNLCWECASQKVNMVNFQLKNKTGEFFLKWKKEFEKSLERKREKRERTISRRELEGNLEICKEKLFELCKYFNFFKGKLLLPQSKFERVEIEKAIFDIIERRKKYERIARELEYLLKYPGENIEADLLNGVEIKIKQK